jgi:Uri superfamily endonuclease
MKGTYILAIYLDKQVNIIIGSLGRTCFPKGLYLYVGSAMANSGSASLINRIKRHLLPNNQKKKHWHIDYFLGCINTYIIKLFILPSEERYECILAEEILKKADASILNFGSSDCSCRSHLFHFKNLFDFELLDIL